MDVSFRDRKFQRRFDSSYFLMDGGGCADAPWLTGESVTILFPATSEHKKAIEKYQYEIRSKEGFQLYPGIRGVNEFTAHIPCVVVERRHSASWGKIGEINLLSTNYTLEAVDGEWEDLLAWIIVGKKPDWAE